MRTRARGTGTNFRIKRVEPYQWHGLESKSTIWKAKRRAHYRMMGDSRVGRWAKWAQVQKLPTTSDVVGLEFGDITETGSSSSTSPPQRFGDVSGFRSVLRVGSHCQGGGSEVMRVIRIWHEPRTAESKRTCLRHIMTTRQATTSGGHRCRPPEPWLQHHWTRRSGGNSSTKVFWSGMAQGNLPHTRRGRKH